MLFPALDGVQACTQACVILFNMFLYLSTAFPMCSAQLVSYLMDRHEEGIDLLAAGREYVCFFKTTIALRERRPSAEANNPPSW